MLLKKLDNFSRRKTKFCNKKILRIELCIKECKTAPNNNRQFEVTVLSSLLVENGASNWESSWLSEGKKYPLIHHSFF